ncbi:hypothetical protein FB567DRAFT_626361 [Paraphoma chrysanthemicola]|uniref:Transmembrane protein n=1 Tax=Paraphoma chrysanthemicola TaxID=798071 RepID=A0A8K0W0G5_9PLEO|nr:hypothetical protein FB567DRAFT_626361 [Paraphoma chrysanthemicola]
MYRPRTTTEWMFFSTATLQALLTIALDIFVIITYFSWINPVIYQVPASYVVPLNFALFVLGNMYQAYLAFDALRTRNNLQLYSICVVNLCLFVFGVMRFKQTERTARSLHAGEALGNLPFTDRDVDWWGKVAWALGMEAGVVGVGSLASCVLVFLLQREFRWAVYRHISGGLEMLRRYLAYEVLLVLVRIEVYFVIGFVLLYGLVDVHYEQPEFALTIAIIPALVIQVALTIIFTKSENVFGAVVAIVLRLGEMAYLLSRILVLTGHGIRANTLLKDEMLLYAGVALALATLACLNAMLCLANFNKGLKPLLQRSSWNKSAHEFEPVNQHRYSERIELD